MFAKLICSLSLAFATTPPPTPPESVTSQPTWPQLAVRMTGESDHVRDQSLRELRATPHLVDLLRAELRKPTQPSRTKMFLALDVISALKAREMLPDLIELSETETSGYLYHAINTLVTPQNRASIVDLYRARVRNRRTSPAARMALIDTLARFGSVMKPTELAELLKDPASGVRETALSYARTFLIRRLQPDYIEIVKDQLTSGSFSIRAQAIFLLRELRKSRLPLGDWPSKCRGDASEAIRTLCVNRVVGS